MPEAHVKVLIVKVSALGDIVHALPVLAYLHAAITDLTASLKLVRAGLPSGRAEACRGWLLCLIQHVW